MARIIADYEFVTTDIRRSPPRCAAQRSYAEAEQLAVLDPLSTVPNEWTRQAVLILANGDCCKLFELIELAELDYREIPCRIDHRSFHGLPADELINRRTQLGLSLPRTHAETNAERQRQYVINFVAESMIVSIDRLSDSTQLQNDLDLTGMESDRFIHAFADQFHVELSGYDFRKHFAAQPGDNFWADIKALLFGRKQAPIIPITIRDLLVAADTHQWMLNRQNAT